MSRHGKPADDSARLSVVVPKDMKIRIECAKATMNSKSISDAVRVCIEYGLSVVEKYRRICR